MTESAHDSFTHDAPPRPGSDRTFGLCMATVLCVIAAIKRWSSATSWWPFAVIGILFAVLAWLAPKRLAPLNWIWFRFGLLLHAVVSPIVLGLVFFGVVTPIGLLMRGRGHRPLAPGSDNAAESYWVPRRDGTQHRGSMRKQY